jgi:hypothetical protein
MTAFCLISPDKRWLLLNGSLAEEYANSLLMNDMSYQQPDRFIDYSVSSQDDYVIFSSHSNKNVFYGYFPNGLKPVNNKVLQWEVLNDNWYVAHP